jgi:hypothetical protein
MQMSVCCILQNFYFFGSLLLDCWSIGADANVVAGGVPNPDAGASLDGPTNLFSLAVR